MIEVIFENAHYLAVKKPAGFLTVPSRFQEKDERPCLGLELQKLKGRLWPVHRLDFEVMGLVLFARNEKAHQLANTWFEQSLVHKTYYAVTGRQDFSHWPKNIEHPTEVIDSQDARLFQWESRIEKGKRRSFASPRGKKSITQAQILKFENNKLFWQLHPLTGRSHQLRFELSQRGFPILGDRLYGGSPWGTANEIALCSVEIDFSKVNEKERNGLPMQLSLPKKEIFFQKFGDMK